MPGQRTSRWLVWAVSRRAPAPDPGSEPVPCVSTPRRAPMSVVAALLCPARGRYPGDSTPLSTGCAGSKRVHCPQGVPWWRTPAGSRRGRIRTHPFREGENLPGGLVGRGDANNCGGCGSTGRPQVQAQLSPPSGVSRQTRGAGCDGVSFVVELTLSTRTTYRWQVCTGVDRCRMSMTSSVVTGLFMGERCQLTSNWRLSLARPDPVHGLSYPAPRVE